MEKEFEIVDSEDYSPPKYSKRGYLEFEITRVIPIADWYQYEVEEIEADVASSVYWICEGMGLEYWVNAYIDLELPGKYRVEGITGTYHKGDYWAGEDDDEDWDFERVIRIE